MKTLEHSGPLKREAFESYKKAKINHPEVELILCGNKYQFDYYLKAPREDCLERFKKLSQVKKRFFIVELNGSSWKIYHEASKTFQVGDLRKYGISSSAVAVAKRTHP